MNIDLPLTLLGLFCLSCLVLALILPSRFYPAGSCLIVVLGLTGGLRWWAIYERTQPRVEQLAQLAKDLPHIGRRQQYVSSNKCRSCHPGEYASWHRTYHHTMTQIALPENVVGKFDGTTINSNGLAYRVYRDGDEFWAEMPDPDEMMYVVQGKKPKPLNEIPRVKRRVVMTTGSHHYQTYWVAGDKKYGRLMQTLPLIYLIKDQRWIPREAAFMFPAGSTRLITQWNHHCIGCHSTGANPGLDLATKQGKFDTSVGELGISCEACHGPAEEHIRLNQDPLRRYRLHLSGKKDESIVNPENLDHKKSSQVCGQCHGVFIREDDHGMKYAVDGEQFRPGDDIHKIRYYIQYPREGSTAQQWEELKRNPEFFKERWWDDGTVLAGGREYSAISVTGCYNQGKMSCLHCHSLHHSDPTDQLKPGMRTSNACTQCHEDSKYTTQISLHTFHQADSPGSNCLNCHMPHTTYALFGAIRNHQIASPSAASSIRHGTPNACNLCHLDQTLAWTQQNLAKWYGIEEVPLSEEQKNISAALLWLLKGHAAQRVIAAWHVGWDPAQQASGNDWLAPFQAILLADPYGVVRYVAEHNLQKLPGFEDFRYDFLAPKRQLLEEASEVVERWKKSLSKLPSRTGPHVLIDSKGELMEARYRQLVKERDNRPVSIKE